MSIYEIKTLMFLLYFSVNFLILGNEISVLTKQRSTEKNTGEFKGMKLVADTIKIFAKNREPYIINYSRIESAQKDKSLKFCGNGSAGLGFQIPAISGWYLYNSIEASIDNEIATRIAPAQYIILKDSDKVLIPFIWDNECARVEISLLIFKSINGLFIEIGIKPKKRFKTIKIDLQCYPGQVSLAKEFGSQRKIMLNSGRMMGASSEIDNGWKASKSYNVNLDLTGENWIFYLDEIFDYEKNTLTSAPCAIVMDKNCFSKGDIHVSAYGVKTSLELPRGNEKARFALFEFHKKSNSEALEWLKINVDKIQDIIKNADFSTSPRAQAEMLRQLDMTAKLLIELRTAAGKELQAKEKKLREKILNSGQLDVIKIRELKTDINSLHEKVTEAGLADLIAPQAHENNK